MELMSFRSIIFITVYSLAETGLSSSSTQLNVKTEANEVIVNFLIPIRKGIMPALPPPPGGYRLFIFSL